MKLWITQNAGYLSNKNCQLLEDKKIALLNLAIKIIQIL